VPLAHLEIVWEQILLEVVFALLMDNLVIMSPLSLLHRPKLETDLPVLSPMALNGM
jgi:hypothetical protein